MAAGGGACMGAAGGGGACAAGAGAGGARAAGAGAERAGADREEDCQTPRIDDKTNTPNITT